MVLLMLMSVTVALAGVNKDAQPDKTYDGLQIFEKELSTTAGDEYVPDEFIVKFKPEVGKKKIGEINHGHGTSIKRAGSHFMRLNVPEGKTVDEMVKAYSRNPNVEYAEPNHIAHALMVPNDPFYNPYQWHLDIPENKEISAWHGDNGGGINIEPAWDTATGTGAIVAVIDTGVAYENYGEYMMAPDLANTCFVAGYDFVNNDVHPNDDEGHGTHVTGTIAQSTNNGVGIAGVAFDCSIMPIKVLGSDGSGYYSWIADGIYYAADNGAQVISMSLGGTSTSDVLEDALAYAYEKNVTIVCSAGNGGPDGDPGYPAAYDAYCIAVGATRYDETVSYYSTNGNYVDIAAPGGDLTVDQNRDRYGDGVLQQTHDGSDYTTFGYYFYQGTSMAAPHVSGVAALLISNGVTSPDDVREALQSTAEDKGAPGRDPAYGWGIVDAYAALQWSAESNKPPVAYGQSVTTDEDTSVDVTLSATDVDGDSLTYSIVANPSHGTVALSGNTATYTPATNYNGADSFTFKANDGTVDSNTATVHITVIKENNLPTMHIASIEMSTTRYKANGWYTYATATVAVFDAAGDPLGNATVEGHWSGLTSGNISGTTDAEGHATLNSDLVKNAAGTFTFEVDDVVLTGWTYDPAANVETNNSTTV